MYRTTGIQTIRINTVFQLLAERENESLAAAPARARADLLAKLGSAAQSRTRPPWASTTGLLDARSGRWRMG